MCNQKMERVIVSLMSEMGAHRGYAAYFMLLEHCTGLYEDGEPIFKIREKNLRSITELSPKRIQHFFEICEEFGLFSVKKKDKTYEILWPAIAEIADEYTKKKIKMSRLKAEKDRLKPSLEQSKVEQNRKEYKEAKVEGQLVPLKNQQVREQVRFALRRFGRNSKEAKAFLGGEIWALLQIYGGWSRLCSCQEKDLEFKLSQIKCNV